MLSTINNLRYVDGISFSIFKLLVILHEKGPLNVHQIAEHGHMTYDAADALRNRAVKKRMVTCIKRPPQGNAYSGDYDLVSDIKDLF